MKRKNRLALVCCGILALAVHLSPALAQSAEIPGGAIDYPSFYQGYCADNPLDSGCPRWGLEAAFNVPETVEIGQLFDVHLTVKNILPPDPPRAPNVSDDTWTQFLDCLATQDPFVLYHTSGPEILSSRNNAAAVIMDQGSTSGIEGVAVTGDSHLHSGETVAYTRTFLPTDSGRVYFYPGNQEGTFGFSAFHSGMIPSPNRVFGSRVGGLLNRCGGGFQLIASQGVSSPWVEIVNRLTAEVILDPAEPGVGEPFSATVRVTNNFSQPVTQVRVEERPDDQDPDLLDPEETPAVILLAEPFETVDLAPGESHDFVYRYKAVAPGTVHFYPDVSGKISVQDADGLIARILDEHGWGPYSDSALQTMQARIDNCCDLTAETSESTLEITAGLRASLEVSNRKPLADLEPLTVTLRVANDGDQPFTDLTPTLDWFQDATAGLGLMSGPSPTHSAALDPGGETAFTYEFWPANSGFVTITGRVDALDAQGEPASDSGEPITIEILSGLVATIRTNVEETAASDPFTVEITVANTTAPTTNKTFTDVSFHLETETQNGKGTLQQLTPTPPLVPVLVPGGDPAVFRIEFAGDKEDLYRLKAFGTAKDEGQEVHSPTVETSVKVGSVLEFTARVTNPPAGTLLPAGVQIQVEGTVKNLSKKATLKLAPLLPETKGNAGLATFSGEGPAPDPRDLVPPDFLVLDPGESRNFRVRVITSYSDPRTLCGLPQGGTRARLEFTPWGIATLDDGTEIAVGPDNTKATEQDLKHEVAIDDSIELPETNHAALAGAISIGTLEGVWNFTAAMPMMLWETAKLPVTLVRGVAEFQSQVWNSLTDEEKEEISRSTANMVLLVLIRNAELAGQKFEHLDELWAQVNATVLQSMTQAQIEWETGDYTSTAQLYSRFAGEQIAGVAVPWALGKLAKSPKVVAALERANTAIQTKVAPVLAQMLRVQTVDEAVPLLTLIDSGAEFAPDVLVRAAGIAPEDAAAIQEAVEHYKILATFRSRHPTSIEWIRRYGAVMKPEKLKIKTVSDVDVLLGYRPEDVGRLVFKKPKALIEHQRTGRPIAEIIDEMLRRQGVHSGDTRYWQAFDRNATRIEEWQKYEFEYKGMAKSKWIDVGFNYRDNGIPSTVRRNESRFRRFAMEPVAGEEETYVLKMSGLKMGDEHFTMRPITGDIDGVAFTHLDGSPLSPEEHVAVLRWMQKDTNIQLQHGESGTFFKSLEDGGSIGGIDFIVKNLKDEPAIQFIPGMKPRAVRFNPNKSQWNGPCDHHLHWDGGYVHTGAQPPLPPSSPPDIVVPPPTPPPDTVPLGMLPGRAGDGPAMFGRCAISYGNGADARALRLDSDGVVREYLAGQGWQATAVGEICVAEGEALEMPVTPSTVLTQAVQAGDTILPVDDDPFTFPGTGADGFQIGQQIVIDPGGEREESACIAGFESLHLKGPLRFAHQAGATVIAIADPAHDACDEVTTRTVPGDVDGSCANAPPNTTCVDLRDVLLLFDLLVNRDTGPLNREADLDGDGRLGLADLIRLLLLLGANGG